MTDRILHTIMPLIIIVSLYFLIFGWSRPTHERYKLDHHLKDKLERTLNRTVE